MPDSLPDPHPLPLANVRILAIEQMQAMPYATQLLAHLGAEVVKGRASGARRERKGRGAPDPR